MIAPRRHPSSRPFLATPRVDFYHPARAIDTALQGLDRLVRRSEGIGLVVGPPGTGKSLLLAMVAETVGDDFAVALLTGTRICTRRALWQAILAAIGEPYRGIEEGELRIGVVERIRGLAATGSGLVVLVDEGHTLPTRLIEELRQLTNIPTPMPAVHIVLAGTAELEEILGSPKMESFTQRIGARHYLEPLDHAETVAYVRTQMKMAGLEWDAAFEPGCDDAVFTATDGVPRLINQLCDIALVASTEAGRERVTPDGIAAAWSEIQRLPPPAALAAGPIDQVVDESESAASPDGIETAADAFGSDVGVVEFGSFDDATLPETDAAASTMDGTIADVGGSAAHGDDSATAEDPWHGPEVELVFDAAVDPFEEYFEQEEPVMERYVMRGPEDFRGHRPVASREGAAMARQLDAVGQPAGQASACQPPSPCRPPLPSLAPSAPAVAVVAPPADIDDADMVVIEEDILEHPSEQRGKSIFAVRPGDYRSLFARLRRGDK
ncbi:MAG: AAA family ATPase [Planctomycetes bacterium]|nr:AAA family ATPase [Planctomycetota bacterium]